MNRETVYREYIGKMLGIFPIYIYIYDGWEYMGKQLIGKLYDLDIYIYM